MPDKSGLIATLIVFCSTVLGVIGKTVFITKKDLDNHHTKCSSQVCSKIAEFKEDTKDHFKTLDKKVDENAKMLARLDERLCAWMSKEK